MQYYANPRSDGPVADAMNTGQLGAIATPGQGNKLQPGWDWCADNGAFGKGYPGGRGYL